MNVVTSYLDKLHQFQKDEHSLEQFQWIPSVKHRHIIAEVLEPLNEITDVDFLCPTIVLGQGDEFYYTCNNPTLAAAYSSTALGKTDKYFKVALQKNMKHFFPSYDYDDIDTDQKSIVGILSHKFGMNNSYCLVKPCDDFTLVVGVGNSNPVDNLPALYKNSHKPIEDILIDYFNQLMPIYIEECPPLKHTQFANDSQYRSKVIRGLYQSDQILFDSITQREAECLYWSSKGKLTAEVAKIMKISEYTVTEHKKSIMKKLNAKNMVNAVYKATKYNIIP